MGLGGCLEVLSCNGLSLRCALKVAETQLQKVHEEYRVKRYSRMSMCILRDMYDL